MTITSTWQDEYVRRVKAACLRDALLGPLTTFRIGGPADVLVEPAGEDEALDAWNTALEMGVPLAVLGGGSNMLVADKGVRGVVLRLAGRLSQLVVSDEGRHIEAGAGASFPRLTRTCMGLGWTRTQGWVGTPGTVGGALIMNAGSRQGEIGDVVESVRALVNGKVVVLPREACGFQYRTSAFPGNSLLLSSSLRCPTASVDAAVDIEALAQDALRRRKQSQPHEHSAGSIFKNPPNDYAGRLIEACGLKGRREGGALISPVHANFIVNTGGASAHDVIVLAETARTAVQAKFGTVLEWEVRRIGDFT